MLHCIMMCTNTVVSSNLCRFLHSFGQECPFTNLSNQPQVSFAASDSAKNNNNPMQWPGKPNIIVPNCPTFNLLEVLHIYTNKSNLGNLMFLPSIDKLCATFLVSYLHILTIQFLMTYIVCESRGGRPEIFYSFSVSWVDRRRLW